MTRDQRKDGLKFIIIFLVVLGHLDYNDYGICMNRMISAFHMPIFVFLSGYFSSQETETDKQKRWLKKTLTIYAVAQLAHFLLSILLEYASCTFHNEPFDTSIITWRILISPKFALWYLICLIYWRLSLWHIFRNISNRNLIVISCILAIVSGFIPIDHDFSFQRAFAFFPFFVSGLIFRKQDLIRKINRLPVICALITTVFLLALSRMLPNYMPSYHYESYNDLLLRILQSAMAFILCICILRLSDCKWIERLAEYGKYTLWIYIGHTFLAVIGYKAFPYLGIRLNLFTASLLALLYCFLFVLLAKLYTRITNRSLSNLSKET